MSSRSELILSMYLGLCMITMPPLLSVGKMMMFRFWVKLGSACIYLLGRDESFGWETEVRMIPWMKPLESWCRSSYSCLVWYLWWCCCVNLSQILVLGWGLPFQWWKTTNQLNLGPFQSVRCVSTCFHPKGVKVCLIVCGSGCGWSFI